MLWNFVIFKKRTAEILPDFILRDSSAVFWRRIENEGL